MRNINKLLVFSVHEPEAARIPWTMLKLWPKTILARLRFFLSLEKEMAGFYDSWWMRIFRLPGCIGNPLCFWLKQIKPLTTAKALTILNKSHNGKHKNDSCSECESIYEDVLLWLLLLQPKRWISMDREEALQFYSIYKCIYDSSCRSSIANRISFQTTNE